MSRCCRRRRRCHRLVAAVHHRSLLSASAGRGSRSYRSGRCRRIVVAMDAAQIDHNRFCTMLVNLARQLVLCGAYSEMASAVSRQDGVLELSVEGRELGQMLLMVLDGS